MQLDAELLSFFSNHLLLLERDVDIDRIPYPNCHNGLHCYHLFLTEMAKGKR